MSKYNKYINNFANEAEYETYINGSVAEIPNTALIDDTGKMIYTKILPNNYVMFGTTKGTQDFKICENSIQIHVVVEDESGVNKMYVAPEDVLKTVTNFFNCFSHCALNFKPSSNNDMASSSSNSFCLSIIN